MVASDPATEIQTRQCNCQELSSEALAILLGVDADYVKLILGEATEEKKGEICQAWRDCHEHSTEMAKGLDELFADLCRQYEVTPGTPEVTEINQIVADLNLLREEKVWVDTFKTKGASIVHLQTGDTATIIEPPQTIYSLASYEERAMHIKWADGSEMVVDSNDFAPSSLQKQIAEITHGKPIPEFPKATGTPGITERGTGYGFLQLSEAEYGEALKSGRYPEPTRYERLTEYYTEPREPGWKGLSLAELFPGSWKKLRARGVPDQLSPSEVKTVIEEKRIPYGRGVAIPKVEAGTTAVGNPAPEEAPTEEELIASISSFWDDLDFAIVEVRTEPCSQTLYAQLLSAARTDQILELCPQIKTETDHTWCLSVAGKMEKDSKQAAQDLVRRCPPRSIISGLVKEGLHIGDNVERIKEIEHVCALAEDLGCLDIIKQVMTEAKQ